MLINIRSTTKVFYITIINKAKKFFSLIDDIDYAKNAQLLSSRLDYLAYFSRDYYRLLLKWWSSPMHCPTAKILPKILKTGDRQQKHRITRLRSSS